MKKALSLILAIVLMTVSFVTVYSAEHTEISLKVGDKSVSINGTDFTVEAPIIVGAGVTMVPIRIIVTAFGADIDWNGETQTVSINYPDKDVTMVIGNKNATVNGEIKELLEAPLIVGNGTTMVPLRFISETFGAKVSWDDATRRVTVTLENNDSAPPATYEVADYITDSYWGWSMKKPQRQGSVRSDCTSLYFYHEDYNNIHGLYIFEDEIYNSHTIDSLHAYLQKIPEYAADLHADGYDFQDIIGSKGGSMEFMARDYLNATIYESEIRQNASGERYSAIIFENDNELIAVVTFLKGDRIYFNRIKNSYGAITRLRKTVEFFDTFETNYKETAFDLSNVTEDGIFRMHDFSKNGMEMMLPANFYSYDSANGPDFDNPTTDEKGYTINYNPVKEGVESLAKRLHDEAISDCPFSNTTVSDMEEFDVNGNKLYSYKIHGEVYDDKKTTSLLVFIDRGDFFQYMRIFLNDNMEYADDIVKSIKLYDVDVTELVTTDCKL